MRFRKPPEANIAVDANGIFIVEGKSPPDYHEMMTFSYGRENPDGIVDLRGPYLAREVTRRMGIMGYEFLGIVDVTTPDPRAIRDLNLEISSRSRQTHS